MNDRKHRVISVSIVLLVLFGIVFGIYTADALARRSADRRAEAVLRDSAREQAATLVTATNGQFQVLRAISESLNQQPELDDGALNAHLAELADAAALSRLRLLRPDGTLIDAAEDYNFSDRHYFKTAIQGENAMEYTCGRMTGENVVILAAPRVRGGVIIGVISGLYYQTQFDDLISSQVYSGAGRSCVVDGSGNVIADAQAEPSFAGATNVLDALRNVDFCGDASLEKLSQCLQSGQSMSFRFDSGGLSLVAALYPLGSEHLPDNDWFVLNTVNASELSQEIGDSRQNAMAAMGVFALFTLLSVGLFLYLERDHRRRLQRDADELSQREEQFRIVARQSGRFVCRYDIPADTLYPDGDPANPMGAAAPYRDVAEHDIASGRVAEECANEYRDFFRRVRLGESPVKGDFLLTPASDGENRRWYRYVSTTLFNRQHKPATAVISYFDYTELRERELAYLKWQREISGMSYENAFLYEWNLTRDVCEGVRGSLPASQENAPRDSFDAWSAAFAEGEVADEDRAAYLAFMNRERLVGMFYNATDHASLDYRARAPEGGERWRRLSVQMAPYPQAEAVKAYVVNRDIDDEKRAELQLISRSEHDSLTGALNRETLIDRLSLTLANAPASIHAVMMLDVDRFKQINDRLGHGVGDQVLVELARCIRSVLRANDCIGRLGGDEFIICLPDMPAEAVVAKKAALLCSLLRRPLSDGMTVSVSLGVALYPRDGQTFEQLYRNADAALYHAKSMGRDGYAFYQPSMSKER